MDDNRDHGDLTELQAKVDFFAQLGAGEYGDAAKDEFDPREAEDRRYRRRFFQRRESSSIKPYNETHANIDDDLVFIRATRITGPAPDTTYLPSTGAKAKARSVAEHTLPNIAIPRRRGRVAQLLHSDGADEPVVSSSVRAEKTTLLQRSNSTPLPRLKRVGSSSLGETSPSSDKSKNKRLKQTAGTGTLIGQSDEPLLFEGHTFFYIPDNDIAPVRKIRIAKARENGAQRTRDIREASHVVVDRALDFKAIQSYMWKVSPSRPPIVVNDEYPIECIQFGSMVDPCQTKYRLSGQPGPPEVAEVTPVEVASSFESVRSLQLKAGPQNPRRWDYVPPAGTPLRSEESAESSRQKPSPVPLGDYQTHTTFIQEHHDQEEVVTAGHDGSDELSDLISVLHAVKTCPVDVDNEHGEGGQKTHEAADNQTISSDDESSGWNKMARKRKHLTFKERFACNQAGPREAAHDNPNARTIEILQKMATYYDRINDHWRTTAYRKAISTLKRQASVISTEKEASKLPGVGWRIARKIEEIVSTDRLQRLEHAEKEPMEESVQLFMGIYGVGSQLARQWTAQGLRTLEDVRAKAKLSTNQKIGLDHYEDLNTRIPRREMDQLARIVTEAAQSIDPGVEVIVGGSYRRGAESSGDIDFILTKPGTCTTAELTPFLRDLVQDLESTGFLRARLASSRSDDDGSKWHGCCVLAKDVAAGARDPSAADDAAGPKWRRIDMLLVPETERGAALIYFTGNDLFNRSMRLLASRKGMRLNQRGLYGDVLRGPGRQKLSEGELLEGWDERRIFEILGVRWREPHERWC